MSAPLADLAAAYEDDDVSTTCGTDTSRSISLGTSDFAQILNPLMPDEWDVPPVEQVGGPYTWRRRKYSAPSGVATGLQAPLPALDVVIEGPLQVRRLGLFWSLRWCVLDAAELRIYESEATERAPLQAFKVRELVAAPVEDFEGTATQVFELTDPEHGYSFATLRAGNSGRWEELAAARLWILALQGVGLSARHAAAEKQRQAAPAEEARVKATAEQMASEKAAGSALLEGWGALAGG